MKKRPVKRPSRAAPKAHRASFWTKLPKPFFAVAPMANVTDSVFRQLFAKYGRPDVTWTEFVSADGLVSPGRRNLLNDLKFSQKERPIVAQLFTGHPEAMFKAAQIVKKLKFDGLDINMGCPDRAVEKQGGGAALIKDQKAALAVLEAARNGSGLPVSIKTRLGYNVIDLNWIKLLLEQRLPALTIHLRTRKEMSEVPAHWELMPEIIRMRDEIQSDLSPVERTLIIGNGDVDSISDGIAKAKKYSCDGIMIGRGIFGKPWFFENIRSMPRIHLDAMPKSSEQRLKIMVEHAKLFEKTFCDRNRLKSFDVMKKHFKAYVSGWDGAKELRVNFMECRSAKEVEAVARDYLKSNTSPR